MRFLIKFSESHINLISYELKAYIDQSNITWVRKNLALVNCSKNIITEILHNHSSVHYILKAPVFTDRYNVLNPLMVKSGLEYTPIPDNSSFVSRYYHLGDKEEEYVAEKIEAKIGSWILKNQGNLQVNLTKPDFKHFSISWNNEAAYGWVFGESSYSSISWRHPKEGPYFQGGAMKPKLCRLLVNLLFPFNATILDPFCGHGGILREVADFGLYGIGIEVSKKVAREMLENNRYFGYEDLIDLIMGDSLNAPYRKGSFGQVVTDPPYAIQTTTIGLKRDILLQKWLDRQNGEITIVFTTPKDMLDKISGDWEIELDEDDFVHKSLSRRVRRIKLRRS